MKIDELRVKNCRVARQVWGDLDGKSLRQLRLLTSAYCVSVEAGDIQLLAGRWYVTHSGLLNIANRRRCQGIRTSLQETQSDPISKRWVFKATVYKSQRSQGFVGYGDADPSNISPFLHGSEMRIAETRAVNRALRKAYGVGLCSVEELGWSPQSPEPAQSNRPKPLNVSSNGHHPGQPRLRDRLCVLIRQYELDPTLVKAYAAHFCGTQTIKEASRELVESFVSHLATSAKEDRDGLVCKLNSFAPVQEARQ